MAPAATPKSAATNPRNSHATPPPGSTRMAGSMRNRPMGIEQNHRPHTINSSLALQRSSESNSRKDPQKTATIALLLSRLAVHFYRPDFTEGQARSMIGDMVGDLS